MCVCVYSSVCVCVYSNENTVVLYFFVLTPPHLYRGALRNIFLKYLAVTLLLILLTVQYIEECHL